MITWGWKITPTSCEKIDTPCLSCYEENVYFIVGLRTFHVFEIPILPEHERTYTYCLSCNSAYEPEGYVSRFLSHIYSDWRSLGTDILSPYTLIKKFLFSRWEPIEITNFKNNPQVGRYFVFKISDKRCKEMPYVFARIEAIENETVLIRMNEYAHAQVAHACDVAKKQKSSLNDPWESRIFGLPINDFKGLPIESLVD